MTILFIYICGYLVTLPMEIKITKDFYGKDYEFFDSLMCYIVCLFWPLVLGSELGKIFIDSKK